MHFIEKRNRNRKPMVSFKDKEAMYQLEIYVSTFK